MVDRFLIVNAQSTAKAVSGRTQAIRSDVMQGACYVCRKGNPKLICVVVFSLTGMDVIVINRKTSAIVVCTDDRLFPRNIHEVRSPVCRDGKRG